MNHGSRLLLGLDVLPLGPQVPGVALPAHLHTGVVPGLASLAYPYLGQFSVCNRKLTHGNTHRAYLENKEVKLLPSFI
jgi:hypothetical protein